MLRRSLVSPLVLLAVITAGVSCRTQPDVAQPNIPPRVTPYPIVYFEVAGPDGKKLGEFFSTVFG